MKKILMIIQNFHPTVGGAEKQALELSRGITKKGFDVSVLTPCVKDAPCRESIDGVKIIRLFSVFGPFRSLIFVFSSAFHLLTHLSSYDVYHVHLASSHAVIPSLLGRIFKKQVFIKLSGGKDIGELALSRKSFLGRLKMKLIAWGKPQLIMVNKDQENEILLSGLSHLERSFIPNGVNLELYRPVSLEEKTRIREEFGWHGQVFLFVGRFAADKLRLDIFENVLNAWKGAFPSGSKNLLVLVGSGPLEPQYRALIQKNNLAESVIILSSHPDVVRYYQGADVFLLPSITEGLSNAMLEAMACGLPVMGSRVSGIENVVIDGINGFLFDPGDSDLIKISFSSFIKCHFLKNISKSNQLTAHKYDLSKTIEKYQSLYS